MNETLTERRSRFVYEGAILEKALLNLIILRRYRAMRLIIHLDNCEDKKIALLRVYKALPEYYRFKGEDDRRLTIRFNGDAMTIYHDRKDVVIFG